MIPLLLRRLRDKVWPEPLPPAGSFEGQTILITGATAGLGLAATIHFVMLGASVAITSRSRAQGRMAKSAIENRTGTAGQNKVHVFELDMSNYASCVAFMEQLKSAEETRSGLDVAVLNAGLINARYVRSPEGWEQTIQVNTLSTTLLGLLLLQWMKTARPDASRIPHLVFVTSRDHIDPDIGNWSQWASEGGILHHYSDPNNWPSHKIQPNYAESKLLLTYAVERIGEIALGTARSAHVIVNPVCPGFVITTLGRAIAGRSLLLKLAAPIYALLLGKSADYGARFYVTAARTSADEHGKYIQSLFDEQEYQTLAFQNLESRRALEVKELVWNEIVTEIKKSVPAAKEVEGI